MAPSYVTSRPPGRLYSRFWSRRKRSQKSLSSEPGIGWNPWNLAVNTTALFWTPRAEFLDSGVDFSQEWWFFDVFAKKIIFAKKNNFLCQFSALLKLSHLEQLITIHEISRISDTKKIFFKNSKNQKNKNRCPVLYCVYTSFHGPPGVPEPSIPMVLVCISVM